MSDFVEDPMAVVPDTPEMRAYLSQAASGHCATFSRGFSGCSIAEALTKTGEPHWFLDLLSLWRPAGEPAGSDGLRLAVRNGYLNFYRKGQSVARVQVVRGQLAGHVHVKYFSSDARDRGGQLYGQFLGDRVTSAHDDVAYEGVETLRAWIKVIDEKYSGVEKRLVDALVAVNSNVVDLEMGLPAWRDRKSPLRMDIVTIEDGQIVFWEAKCASDGRIRRSEEQLPEVIEQLAHYQKFLVQDLHREQVAQAYRNAADVLARLRVVADGIEQPRALGPALLAAKDNPALSVAGEAALVVIDDAADGDGNEPGRAWQTWHANGHLAKLKGKARVLAQPRPGILRLGDAV